MANSLNSSTTTNTGDDMGHIDLIEYFKIKILLFWGGVWLKSENKSTEWDIPKGSHGTDLSNQILSLCTTLK